MLEFFETCPFYCEPVFLWKPLRYVYLRFAECIGNADLVTLVHLFTYSEIWPVNEMIAAAAVASAAGFVGNSPGSLLPFAALGESQSFCPQQQVVRFLRPRLHPYAAALWCCCCWPTVAVTGNGEPGFDSGEGASETASTSKESSRRPNYPKK